MCCLWGCFWINLAPFFLFPFQSLGLSALIFSYDMSTSTRFVPTCSTFWVFFPFLESPCQLKLHLHTSSFFIDILHLLRGFTTRMNMHKWGKCEMHCHRFKIRTLFCPIKRFIAKINCPFLNHEPLPLSGSTANRDGFHPQIASEFSMFCHEG